MRAQGCDVRHDPCLVVGGPAPVEPPVTLGRLERRCVPKGLVPDGLDVVVGVEGDGGRTLRPVDVPDDGRPATLADDLDLEPLGAEQLGSGLRRPVDLGLVEGVEGDARDPGERLQVGPYAGHQLGDAGAEGGDLVSGEHVVGHGWEPTHAAVPRRGEVRGRHTMWRCSDAKTSR